LLYKISGNHIFQNDVEEQKHALCGTMVLQVLGGSLQDRHNDLEDIDINLLRGEVIENVLDSLVNLFEKTQSLLSLD